MTKAGLNIELLKKVRDNIATAPDAYDQSSEGRRDKRSPCGTVACIGEWADILSAPDEAERNYRMLGIVDLDRAADALRLGGSNFWAEYMNDKRTERAVPFHGDPDASWPEPFASQWEHTETHADIARVAVAFLDHIIETGKVLE